VWQVSVRLKSIERCQMSLVGILEERRDLSSEWKVLSESDGEARS